jgi:hypothetical protein
MHFPSAAIYCVLAKFSAGVLSKRRVYTKAEYYGTVGVKRRDAFKQYIMIKDKKIMLFLNGTFLEINNLFT